MAKQTTVLEAKIDAKGVKSGAAAIKRELGLVGKSAKGLQDNFDGLKSAILGVVSVGALGSFISETNRATLETGRLAERLGLSVSSLDSFSKQARRVGVDTDTLADAFKELGIRIVEAEQLGSGPAVDALNLLGISLQQIKDLDMDQQFLLITEALGKVENAAERVFIQEELMGDAGARLAPLINKGAKSMRDFREEAEKAGLLMTQEHVEAAKKINEEWSKINAEASALGRETLPAVLVVLREIVEFGTSIKGVFKDARELFTDFLTGQGIEAYKKNLDDINVKIIDLSDSARDAGFSGKELIDAMSDPQGVANETLRGIAENMNAAYKEADRLEGVIKNLQNTLNGGGDSGGKGGKSGLVIPITGGKESPGNMFPPATQKDMERGLQLTKQNRSAVEILNDRLRDAAFLYQAAAVDEITYRREVQAAREEYKDALDEIAEAEKEAIERQQELQDSIVDTFTDGIKAGKDFKDILGDIAAEMVNMILKGEDLGSVFGGSVATPPINGGGSGGFLNTAISAAGSFFGDIGSGIASIFGFADGGRPPTDRPSIVGERGPELFVPDGAGVVVPNGGMGGDTINVYYSPQVNALDPRTAADVIAQNAPTVVGIVQQSFNQQGLRGIRR